MKTYFSVKKYKMKHSNLNIDELQVLFREVGLHNPKGDIYKERTRKYAQLFSYIIQLESALKKLTTKRPVVLVDCGCGKSYLSFLLYEYCKRVLKRKVKIIGIDHNYDIIEKCKGIAEKLNYKYMSFYDKPIKSLPVDRSVDIVYSLHACDTATDQTIAQGIILNAKYIFSVSCCQHTNRSKFRSKILRSVSRSQPYKERLVDMIGDTMRGLLLEYLGYAVKLFEFVAAEHTPKNIVLRAINNAVKKQDRVIALDRYQELVETFHFKPALEALISHYLQANQDSM